MQKSKTLPVALPSIRVTSGRIAGCHNHHNIRRLSGIKFSPSGQYIETVVWFLVDGIPGKHLTYDEAVLCASKKGIL